MTTFAVQLIVMARPSHPQRARALHLMRAGLATPGEIAAALGISRWTVETWRRRARIWTDELRVAHVRKLLMRGNGHGGDDKANERLHEAVHPGGEA